VERLVADVQPVKTNGAVVLGQSALDLQIEEARPYHLDVQIGNYRPASIGAEVMDIIASHQNLTRNSDALELRYGLLQRSKGDSVEFSGLITWSELPIPVTARDTTVGAFYDRERWLKNRSTNLISTATMRRIKVVRQSIIVAGHRVKKGLFEYTARVSCWVSHFRSRLMHRNRRNVLRLTRNGTVLTNQILTSRDRERPTRGIQLLREGPDGRFVSILGQGQYLRRLNPDLLPSAFAGSQFILRGGFQWTDDPLLAMEQFSLGGANTVRGYRENQLVRDTGVFASAELRVPIIRSERWGEVLQVAPFFDFGAGRKEIESRLGQYESVGVG
jgi:hemolysin activation/secretion protein